MQSVEQGRRRQSARAKIRSVAPYVRPVTRCLPLAIIYVADTVLIDGDRAARSSESLSRIIAATINESSSNIGSGASALMVNTILSATRSNWITAGVRGPVRSVIVRLKAGILM